VDDAGKFRISAERRETGRARRTLLQLSSMPRLESSPTQEVDLKYANFKLEVSPLVVCIHSRYRSIGGAPALFPAAFCATCATRLNRIAERVHPGLRTSSDLGNRWAWPGLQRLDCYYVERFFNAAKDRSQDTAFSSTSRGRRTFGQRPTTSLETRAPGLQDQTSGARPHFLRDRCDQHQCEKKSQPYRE
jgi:hypothetical protein